MGKLHRKYTQYASNNLIHNFFGGFNMIYAFDGYTPEIGEGTYVSETAIVIGNVKIVEKCYIGHGSILRGDYGRIEIGSETAIEEG